MLVVLAEFIGTMLLIIFGGGVVAGVVLKGTKSEGSGWIVITAAWGLGVAMSVYLIGEISGGHINPAVTIGLALIGDFSWVMVLPYIIAQILGALTGGILVFYFYYPHWKVTEDKGAKLGVFATSPAIKHTPQNFFSEVLGTFVLLFGIMGIGSNEFTAGLNPLIVGLLIVVIGLSLGGTTGYAINPARDLGPRIAHMILPIHKKGSSEWQYAWIPIVGPIIGGALGTLSFVWIFNGVFNFALVIAFLAFFAVLAITIQLEKKSLPTESVERVKHNKERKEA